MTSLPKACLRQVIRISDTSVFLAPKDGETLDFRTVNSAPPTHRSVLQKNGLIAKVCLGVAAVSGDATQRETEAVSEEGRAELWRDALVKAKLVSSTDVTKLFVPPAFEQEPWPLLSEEEYTIRMRALVARQEDSEVNTSSFCVPAIAIQQFSYKSQNTRVHVGVVWMPRYHQSLTEWAEARLTSSGKPISEVAVMTMLQHITVGVSAFERIVIARSQGSATADTRQGCPVGLEMDSILVHESENQVSFSLTLSPLTLSTRQSSLAANPSFTRFKQLNLLPYLAPEQVQRPPDTPVVRSPRYATWALGGIALALASGTPSLASQLKRQNRRKAELPLNHPSVTPDAIISRVRRDLEWGGYSAGFIGLLGLLLAPDHRTRPTLLTVSRMLQDLNRAIPVHRFPFAMGELSLLRVAEPERVQLNPSAHKYVTKDACCFCKHSRDKVPCKGRDHTPAIASIGWTGDEPLPGLFTAPDVDACVTYLYPLEPTNLEEKDRRKLLTRAVQGSRSGHVAGCDRGGGGGGGAGGDGVNRSVTPLTGIMNTPSTVGLTVNASVGSTALFSCGATMMQDTPSLIPSLLFQLFGGFAVYEKSSATGEAHTTVAGPKDRAVVTDVLVPFPSKGLRKCESAWPIAELSFTAALPWPSACTAALQKKGRICAQVPALFGGLSSSSLSDAAATSTAAAPRDVPPKYFAWIAPKERFVLEGGRTWTPAPEGGFVFWFGENLEPSDMDRFFAVTSMRSCTVGARVSQTVLPDQVFRKHVGEDANHLGLATFGLGQSVSHQDVSSRHQTPRAGLSASALPSFATARRRSSVSIALVEVPAGMSIMEEERGLAPTGRSGHPPRKSSPAQRGLVAEQERHGGAATTTTITVDSTTASKPALKEAPPLVGESQGLRAPKKAAEPDGLPKPRSECNKDSCPIVLPNGSTPRAGSTDMPTASEGTASRGASANGVAAQTVAAGVSDTERNSKERRSRRRLTPAQRKDRLAVPRMAAIEDVECTTPIVETPVERLRSSSRSSNRNQRMAAESPVPQSAPAAPGLSGKPGGVGGGPLRGSFGRLPIAKLNVEAATAAPLAPLDVNRHNNLSGETSGVKGKGEVAAKQTAVGKSFRPPSRKPSDGAAEVTAMSTQPLPAVGRRPSEVTGPTTAAALPVDSLLLSNNHRAPSWRRGRSSSAAVRPASGSVNSQEVSALQCPLTPMMQYTHTFPKSATLQDGPAVPTASVFGRWLTADAVDAPFDSLTFFVPATREYGALLPPVAVTETARRILHCPDVAVFMSFLSNEAPLLRRNHPSALHEGREALFPHHGFAFYAHDGTLVAALALRCGPAGSIDMDPDIEFPIIGKPLHVRSSAPGAGNGYGAAYFTLADTPGYSRSMTPLARPPSCCPEQVPQGHRLLRHPGSRPPASPQDPQMLTFSSARRLMGDLTPTGSPAVTELLPELDGAGTSLSRCLNQPLLPQQDRNPDTLLPVCWLGFDAEAGALVMGSVDQSAWHPLLIC